MYKELKICEVCNSKNLSSILEVKNLPLTGLYYKKETPDLPSFDQGLNLCEKCRHGQLRFVVDPKIVYDETYTHRSSESTISKAGNDFFFSYLTEITRSKVFKSVLEVGCNDMYLINKLQKTAGKIYGIDPIWEGKEIAINSRTKIFGNFIEELDEVSNKIEKPDLIISSHTFEHVNNLSEQMKQIVNFGTDDCVFVIEMPSFDSLVKQRRFDQVFHQHIQYLSLESMRKLIEDCNCRYIGHKFNYSYWGGTLLFCFEKGHSVPYIDKKEDGYTRLDSSLVRHAWHEYSNHLKNISNLMQDLKEDIYAFGAAQMFPILFHHMEIDEKIFCGIIDDNPARIGKKLYPFKLPIVASQTVEIQNATVFISAIDSSRKIMERLHSLNPRRIISPSLII